MMRCFMVRNGRVQKSWSWESMSTIVHFFIQFAVIAQVSLPRVRDGCFVGAAKEASLVELFLRTLRRRHLEFSNYNGVAKQ